MYGRVGNALNLLITGECALILTATEYFAGIGLTKMGIEFCGWQVIFANDISKKKYEMYKAFFPNADNYYIIQDIFRLDFSKVPVSILSTCSFPCIDLSLAGNMNGINGIHSSAFWGFIQILKAQGGSSSPLILVENVPGWLYSNKGSDFRITVQSLNDLGYACDVFTLDALRFTPQSRLRVFLVGIKSDLPEFNVNLILKRSRSLLSKRLEENLLANQTSKWFYADIPEPPPAHTGGLSKLIEKMDDSDSRWWTQEETERHINMMERSHYERVMQLVKSNQIAYRTFFRRRRKGKQRVEVRNDDLSGCLRTAVGGSGKQFLIKAGKGKIKMRAMTPREYARLQGVPDEYPITVSGVQALTGFGDAVCVPAMTWIAGNILNPLVENYLS